MKLEGADVKWYRVDGADKLTDIDILSDTIQAYEYGTIIYGTSNYVCPYCGTPLYSCYAEAFVLDGKYSPVADQINAKLKEYMEIYKGARKKLIIDLVGIKKCCDSFMKDAIILIISSM